MLKKILISLIISFVVFCLQAYLSFQFLLWLNPPYVIIDGQIRHTMPLGAVFYSMIFGIIAVITGFVVNFRKYKSKKSEKKLSEKSSFSNLTKLNTLKISVSFLKFCSKHPFSDGFFVFSGE